MFHIGFFSTNDERRHRKDVNLFYLVIALVSVHWCLCLLDTDDVLYLSGSSLWLFINEVIPYVEGVSERVKK